MIASLSQLQYKLNERLEGDLPALLFEWTALHAPAALDSERIRFKSNCVRCGKREGLLYRETW